MSFANRSLDHTSSIVFAGGALQWYGSNQEDMSAHIASLGSGSAVLDTNGNFVTFDTGLTGSGGLTKKGAGTLTLNVANTYTGVTTITPEPWQVESTTALPGYNVSSHVVVSSGGTLAVNVGGMGEWEEGDIQTLLSTATFSSGSALGIDTTDGDFTYDNSITGVLGLKKLGQNTLTLTSSANTYSGGTTISAGTLQVTDDGSNMGSLGSGGVVDDASLVFADGRYGSTATVANAISGSGAMTQQGYANTLILTGNSSSYAGTITLDGYYGTLQVETGVRRARSGRPPSRAAIIVISPSWPSTSSAVRRSTALLPATLTLRLSLGAR